MRDFPDNSRERYLLDEQVCRLLILFATAAAAESASANDGRQAAFSPYLADGLRSWAPSVRSLGAANLGRCITSRRSTASRRPRRSTTRRSGGHRQRWSTGTSMGSLLCAATNTRVLTRVRRAATRSRREAALTAPCLCGFNTLRLAFMDAAV